MNEKVDQLGDYLELEAQNDSLARENARLMNILINQKQQSSRAQLNLDSTIRTQYEFIPAEICNKTLRLRNNMMTLCVGSKDGVQPRMGVVSAQGIVGVITNVSDHYSQVIPVVNSHSRISAAIKGSNYFGSLRWMDSDPQIMQLEDIPKHAPISVGDTVITSGYSSIFPKDLEVGRVTTFEVERGSSNYSIDVRLFNDLYNLSYVYVIKNRLQEEQRTLENSANE